jgi:hypothetical protein
MRTDAQHQFTAKAAEEQLLIKNSLFNFSTKFKQTKHRLPLQQQAVNH